MELVRGVNGYYELPFLRTCGQHREFDADPELVKLDIAGMLFVRFRDVRIQHSSAGSIFEKILARVFLKRFAVTVEGML